MIATSLVVSVEAESKKKSDREANGAPQVAILCPERFQLRSSRPWPTPTPSVF